MRMDSQDRNRKGYRGSFTRSFFYAFEGLLFVLRTERNIKFHLFFAAIVISMSLYVQITKVEWLVVILVIGGMFVIEIINTAIENVVDLVTEEYHPLAKIAKDVAASAALVFACISVIIGVILFGPYFMVTFK
ncbi:diacylglycerol kinase family protein [Sutcliffiella horikoshii]|uniref:diacylglycerol kinase family protein n=1 Tax=Sutcliffiella horikoshii TaxID=79883 RepID=UPI002041AFA7|nr:diacylglycerol kinase family protein [Sutcliffiella horikoshii]MCM3619103.1 diacylglycerol kinase family protein [Sutcliffiella horikoshii]